MRYRRNLWTGELEEVDDNPHAEFGEINARARERVKHLVKGRAVNPWYKDNRCRPMSIAPEQATKSRIARENEDARRKGTGAVYAPNGECFLPTRGSRKKEMARRRMIDNDGGFGDG